MTHINIYEGSNLVAVLTDVPRLAWSEARACVNALAADAGRRDAPRGWVRIPGRVSYQRGGFRAVNTFGGDRQ